MIRSPRLCTELTRKIEKILGVYIEITLWRLLITIAAIVVTPSQAHHSFGMFDQADEAEISIEGVVKKWQFINPHIWLIITVRNDDGSLTDWSFEGSAVPTLLRRGIRGDTFEEGQTVTVVAAPMKDGRPGGPAVKQKFTHVLRCRSPRLRSARPSGFCRREFACGSIRLSVRSD